MGERRLSELSFRALGGQPGFDPNDIERFVDARRIGVLAYRRRDGRPNQTPIWYTYRDGVLHMTTTTGSPKHRALEHCRQPSVPSSGSASDSRSRVGGCDCRRGQASAVSTRP